MNSTTINTNSGSLIHRSPVTYMTCKWLAEMTGIQFCIYRFLSSVTFHSTASVFLVARKCTAYHWKALSERFPMVCWTSSADFIFDKNTVSQVTGHTCDRWPLNQWTTRSNVYTTCCDTESMKGRVHYVLLPEPTPDTSKLHNVFICRVETVY